MIQLRVIPADARADPLYVTTAAEASLVGAAPGDGVFAEAGRLAAEASSPVADVRGSVEYKQHMVEVYVRRGLASAFDMAGAA